MYAGYTFVRSRVVVPGFDGSHINEVKWGYHSRMDYDFSKF